MADVNIAAEHQVGSGDGNPVVGTAEARFVGMDKIYVIVAVLGIAAVVEGDTGDGTGTADFRCRIDLL